MNPPRITINYMPVWVHRTHVKGERIMMSGAITFSSTKDPPWSVVSTTVEKLQYYHGETPVPPWWDWRHGRGHSLYPFKGQEAGGKEQEDCSGCCILLPLAPCSLPPLGGGFSPPDILPEGSRMGASHLSIFNFHLSIFFTRCLPVFRGCHRLLWRSTRGSPCRRSALGRP